MNHSLKYLINILITSILNVRFLNGFLFLYKPFYFILFIDDELSIYFYLQKQYKELTNQIYKTQKILKL